MGQPTAVTLALDAATVSESAGRVTVTATLDAPAVRVEGAHPAIVSKSEFRRVRKLLGSRAPKNVHPRRSSSPYLLSGLVKCETCGKALTASEAKSGRYTYYVCHSLLKKGRGTCDSPRLNSKRFECVADAAEVALNGGVMSTVQSGGPELTVGSTLFELVISL